MTTRRVIATVGAVSDVGRMKDLHAAHETLDRSQHGAVESAQRDEAGHLARPEETEAHMSKFIDIWLIGEDEDDALSNFPYLTKEEAVKDADAFVADMRVFQARAEIHADTLRRMKAAVR